MTVRPHTETARSNSNAKDSSNAFAPAEAPDATHGSSSVITSIIGFMGVGDADGLLGPAGRVRD